MHPCPCRFLSVGVPSRPARARAPCLPPDWPPICDAFRGSSPFCCLSSACVSERAALGLQQGPRDAVPVLTGFPSSDFPRKDGSRAEFRREGGEGQPCLHGPRPMVLSTGRDGRCAHLAFEGRSVFEGNVFVRGETDRQDDRGRDRQRGGASEPGGLGQQALGAGHRGLGSGLPLRAQDRTGRDAPGEDMYLALGGWLLLNRLSSWHTAWEDFCLFSIWSVNGRHFPS